MQSLVLCRVPLLKLISLYNNIILLACDKQRLYVDFRESLANVQVPIKSYEANYNNHNRNYRIQYHLIY